jgi:3-methyladenine DNA glycosylase AlkD
MSDGGKKGAKFISPEELAKKAMGLLKSKANPEKAVQAQRYFKEQIASLGLASDEVREIADELYNSVRASWTVREAVELCEVLLPNKYLEAKSLATLIFLKYVRNFDRPHFAVIKKWLAQDYCDNWASVDLLCPDGLGAMLEKDPDLVPKIMHWTDHPNRWVKRASAVSFIKPARRGKLLDSTYRIARRLFPVEDDLIEKANGWLLREAGKTDMPRLERFLMKHGRRIPRTTLRYAIERFPEAKRMKLLKATKA